MSFLYQFFVKMFGFVWPPVYPPIYRSFFSAHTHKGYFYVKPVIAHVVTLSGIYARASRPTL